MKGERFGTFSYLKEDLSMLRVQFHISKSLTALLQLHTEGTFRAFACSKRSFLFYMSCKNVEDYRTFFCK